MKQHSNMRITFEIFIDGRRVGRKRLSRSFVQAFGRLMIVQMQGGPQGSQNDTGGTSRTPAQAAVAFQCTGNLDNSGLGIVVGTGTTTVAVTDTKLITQITTGNGAGQLRYLAQTFNMFTVGSTDVNFQITRSFINNSGATITPTEVGIYGQGGTGWTFCLIRDLFGGGGIAVAAGKTLTVTYTLSFPV